MKERWNKEPMLAFVDSHIIDYPTPTNLSYLWSFGSTAGLCLVIQIANFQAYKFFPRAAPTGSWPPSFPGKK